MCSSSQMEVLLRSFVKILLIYSQRELQLQKTEICPCLMFDYVRLKLDASRRSKAEQQWFGSGNVGILFQ